MTSVRMADDGTTIVDSLHGHIDVGGVARQLLETEVVQRLRHVKQLGTVNFAYPSANHTRFEHSLGVYYLAHRVVEELEVDGAEADQLRAAALLHDIGHPPFSHNLEPLLEHRGGLCHEDLRELLTTEEKDDLDGTLASAGMDFESVLNLILGRGRFGQLVSGNLDVDHVDYLARDALYTGGPYGLIDPEELVGQLTFDDGSLVLGGGNVGTAKELLKARAWITRTVYEHPAARISKTMLRRAVEILLDDDADVDEKDVWRMDDYDLVGALRCHDSTRWLVNRITSRDLFERAIWAELEDVPEGVREADLSEINELEQAVAETADVSRRAVLIENPSLERMPESHVELTVDGEVRDFAKLSELVPRLESRREEQWRFGVYTCAEDIDRVGRAAEDVLGLETDGDFVRPRPDSGPPVSGLDST